MSQIHVFFFFFWIPASSAEAAAVIPNGAKTLFAKGTAIFINGPAKLLNKDPKNPPDWIILLICALESFMSAVVLLLKAFVPVLSFTASFSFFYLCIW